MYNMVLVILAVGLAVGFWFLEVLVRGALRVRSVGWRGSIRLVGASFKEQWGRAGGNGLMVAVVMGFVVIMVIYKMIPMLSHENVSIQASTEVTSTGKEMVGLGEWLFPLGGVLAGVFFLFKKMKG